MDLDEKKKQLVKEITKLSERVKKADLPISLAKEIKEACGDMLVGKNTDKLFEAFLILAVEMKMYELKDKTYRNVFEHFNAIIHHCRLVKLKSDYTLNVIEAAMAINSVVDKEDK